MARSRQVPIRSKAEIAMARRAGTMAAQVLSMIAPHVKAGVTTNALDRLCREYIVDVLRARPANIGYHGYPKTICASVNHVVCHGIPSDHALQDGDIVNIDVALDHDGWYGDTSRMYCVGEPAAPARRLVDATYEAMMAGIAAVRPGATLGDVGHAIQSVAHREGFSIVREYCGHGIGRIYHDEPQVLHYGRPGAGLRLAPGMIFTIEPMLNAGRAETRQLADGWTVVTQDRSWSAQWEHMVVVTEDGFDILTPWPDGEPARSSAATGRPAPPSGAESAVRGVARPVCAPARGAHARASLLFRASASNDRIVYASTERSTSLRRSVLAIARATSTAPIAAQPSVHAASSSCSAVASDAWKRLIRSSNILRVATSARAISAPRVGTGQPSSG